MDLIYLKIMFLTNSWVAVKASPVAMLQHATSSQSFIIHHPQGSLATANRATSPSSIGQSGANQANYEYKYEVSDHQSGDRKSHWETKDGDKVRGVYTLYEPDGALRRVEYTADSIHGFNAIVTRDGQSKHFPPQESSHNYVSSRKPSEDYESSNRGYIPEQSFSQPRRQNYGVDTSGYIGLNENIGLGLSVSHVTKSGEMQILKPY